MRAGERAAALAATQDARRAFDQAERPSRTTRSSGRRCSSARARSRPTATSAQVALDRLDEARALYEAAGQGARRRPRGRRDMSRALWKLGRIEEAIELLEPAFAVLSADEPDADVAMLAAESARVHHFAGQRRNRAGTRRVRARDRRGTSALPEVLSHALNTKALILFGRPHESHALLREALEIALEHDLVVGSASRLQQPDGRPLNTMDRRDEVQPVEARGLELARRRGNRNFAVAFAGPHGRQTLMRTATGTARSHWPRSGCRGAEPTMPGRRSLAYCPGRAWIAPERDERGGGPHLLALRRPDVDATADQQLLSAVPASSGCWSRAREGRSDDLVAATDEQ